MAQRVGSFAHSVRRTGLEFTNTSRLAEPTPSCVKISAFMLTWSTHPFWVYSNPSPRGGRSAAYRDVHQERGRLSASTDRGGGRYRGAFAPRFGRRTCFRGVRRRDGRRTCFRGVRRRDGRRTCF